MSTIAPFPDPPRRPILLTEESRRARAARMARAAWSWTLGFAILSLFGTAIGLVIGMSVLALTATVGTP